jgi:hypothetical protein
MSAIAFRSQSCAIPLGSPRYARKTDHVEVMTQLGIVGVQGRDVLVGGIANQPTAAPEVVAV